MEIAVFAAIALLLLAAVVAFAVGNRGWNVGTVVAAVLVVLTAGGFLYLASRLAARERAWTKVVSDLEQQVVRVRDGLAPAEGGRLEPLAGAKSLVALREERDRWSRTATNVDTWRDRYWPNASYEPDGADGPGIGARIVVPRPPRRQAPAQAQAAGDAAPAAADVQPNEAPQAPLLAPGTMIFLFDESPLAEGGRFLGAFTVREATFDAAIDADVLAATFVGEPNDRERRLLSEPRSPITIFDELPVDRWIAFFRANPPEGDASAAEATTRTDVAAAFEGVEDDGVRPLVEAFIERFAEHDAEVPEAEWGEALRKVEDGTEMTGTFWATVEFTKSHTFADAPGAAPRELAAGDTAQFDLETAMKLRDQDVVKVQKVVRRRPLSDALAAIYGTPLGAVAEQGDGRGDRADGALALARQLRADIAAIETAMKRLDKALEATQANTEATTAEIEALTDDLGSWERDATEAGKVAETFAASVDRTTRERDEADRTIVALGRELSATMARLTAEIDRVAPAPPR